MSNSRLAVRASPTFPRTFLVTACLLALLLPFLNLLIDRSNDPTTAWIHAITTRKHAYAQRTLPDQPRLLVIGGSASHFGIDCQLLELKLHTPTINFATHAGLGVRYLLARAQRELRPGDTALLCLEYATCKDEDYCADYRRDTLFTNDLAYLAHIPLPLALYELYTVPLADYPQSLLSRLDSLRGLRPPRLYPLVTMSPNGDARATSANIAPLGIYNPDPRLLSLISEFAARCRANNIRLLATWPNAYYGPAGPIPAHLAAADAFRRTYLAASIPILGTPADYSFPRPFFGDTNYHLNPAGRRIRTERLLRQLAPFFNLPPTPAPDSPLFLLPSADHHLSPANLSRPDATFKYLTTSDVPPHPDLLHPADLPTLLRAGRDIYYDDPASLAPLLSALHLTSTTISTGELIFPDLLQRYPNHLFLLSLPPSSPIDSDLPPNLYSPTQFRVALLGTGRYASLSRTISSPTAANLSLTLPLPITLYAGPASHPPITADDTPLLPPSSAPTASVAVLDPDLNILLESHTFPTRQITAWELHKLTLAP